MKDGSVSIIKMTRKDKLPRLPFSLMKNSVLGKKYDLSVVIIGRKKMRGLNLKYRGKDSATDILSFALSGGAGEILINPDVAAEKFALSDIPFRHYLGAIFIHGLLHLKGLRHGGIMEREEKKFRARFRVKGF